MKSWSSFFWWLGVGALLGIPLVLLPQSFTDMSVREMRLVIALPLAVLALAALAKGVESYLLILKERNYLRAQIAQGQSGQGQEKPHGG